jgi:hypothetical protein
LRLRRCGLTLATAVALLAFAALLPSLALATAPANDDFADAQQFSGTSVSQGGTTLGATLQAGEPAYGAGNGSVWFKWTAPRNSRVRIGTCAAGPASTLVEVFNGSSLDSLHEVDYNDSSQCPTGEFYGTVRRFRAVAGTTYRIVVIEYAADGAFTLTLSAPAAPANDDFAHAKKISGISPLFRGTTVNATVEPGEPAVEDASWGSVWYRWTAPRNTTVNWDTCSSGVYVDFDVYRGSSLGSLKPVTSTSCKSSVTGFATFRAKKGTTYRVQVHDDEFLQTAPFKLGFTAVFVDVSIKQSPSAKSIRKGGTVTFTIRIRNLGTVPNSAPFAMLTSKPGKLAHAAPGTRYVSFKTTHAGCHRVFVYGTQAGALCHLEHLAPGKTAVIKAKVRPSQSFTHWVYLLNYDQNKNNDRLGKIDRTVIVRGGSAAD